MDFLSGFKCFYEYKYAVIESMYIANLVFDINIIFVSLCNVLIMGVAPVAYP